MMADIEASECFLELAYYLELGCFRELASWNCWAHTDCMRNWRTGERVLDKPTGLHLNRLVDSWLREKQLTVYVY